jgi:hypothetical protein
MRTSRLALESKIVNLKSKIVSIFKKIKGTHFRSHITSLFFFGFNVALFRFILA